MKRYCPGADFQDLGNVNTQMLQSVLPVARAAAKTLNFKKLEALNHKSQTLNHESATLGP